MASNPFDQFDQAPATQASQPVPQASQPQATQPAANPFDQFDTVINQDEDRKLTNLPPPNPAMFKDMDPKTAQEVYKAYLNHPNSEVKDGQLLYNGKPVPSPGDNTGLIKTITQTGDLLMNGLSRPVSYLIDSATGSTKKGFLDYMANPDGTVGGTTSDLGKGITGGAAINAPRNIATGATALGTAGAEKAGLISTETGNKVTDKVNDNLPVFNPKDLTQSIGNTGGEVGAGIVIGNKVAAGLKAAGVAQPAIASLAEKAPKFVSYMANLMTQATGAGLGIGAATDGNGKTLITGPDAMYPLLKGLDGKSQSEAQNILEKRLNTVVDNIAIAMPASAAIDFSKGVLNFAYEGFVKPMLGAANPKMQEQLIGSGLFNDLAYQTGASSPKEKAILQNKLVDFLKDPENRTIMLGDQNAGQLIPGQEGISPINTKLDTASVIARGLAREGADSEEAKALKHGMEAHRKAVIGNFGNLTEQATNRPVNDLAKLTHETQNAFGGDEAIKNSAQEIQKAGQQEVGSARATLENTEGQIAQKNADYQNIVGQNALGKDVMQTGQEPLSAATQTKNALTSQIDQNVGKGIKATNEATQAEWNKIPPGLQVTNTGQLEENLVNAEEHLSPGMVKALKDAVTFGPDGEVLSADFSKLQQLRKPLSDELNNAQGTKGFAPLKALREGLFGQGGEQDLVAAQPGGEQVQKAVDAYKAGERTKSGFVGDIENTNSNLRWDEPKRADTVAGIIQNGLKSNQPNQIQHFADVLSRPEFGQSHDLLPQLMKADIADSFRTQMLGKSGEAPDVGPLLDKIQQYRQMLNSPQFADQAKSFDDFAQQIIQNKNDVAKLGEALKNQTDTYGEVSDKIHNEVLKNFFHKENLPVENGLDGFRNMFKDPSNANQIKYVLKAAQDSGDPTVMDGVRAAYGKALDDAIFTGAENSAGAKVLSKGADQAKLLDAGDQIFTGKYKPIMDAVRQLSDPAMENQVAKSIGASKASPEGFSYKGAKEAQNKVVQMIVGPLTRIGSRVGAISGTILDKLDPGNTARMVKDAMFSDPDTALRILQSLNVSGEEGPQVTKNTYQWLVNTGLLHGVDLPTWQKEVTDYNTQQQTNDAFKNGGKSNKKEK